MSRLRKKRHVGRAPAVRVAEHCGFCFGVTRAIRMARAAVRKAGRTIYSLGPLIHNPQEVKRLEAEGIRQVEDASRLRTGIVVIRSHGLEPVTVARLRGRGLTVVDATCPFVRKAQRLARRLVASGYDVVLLGDPDHPEVKAIVGYAGGRVHVVQSFSGLAKLKLGPRVGLLSQTTQTVGGLAAVAGEMLGRAQELRVYNTVCLSTVRRQDETRRLASGLDLAIVVGGRNSANTKRLVEICRAAGAETRHIESAGELAREWFKGKNRIGITGGASTPRWIIEEVKDRVFSFTVTGSGARIRRKLKEAKG